MNGQELKKARALLNLSQQEAAKLIGDVSKRSWVFWESGRPSIPQDVQEKFNDLLMRRKAIVQPFIDKTISPSNVYRIYLDQNDLAFISDPIELRLLQGVALTLHFDYDLPLVDFDMKDYEQWLQDQDKTDDPTTRSEWASTNHPCSSKISD
ncbi:DUF1870 family protein [Brackiella oedipodis]|uniref:Aca2/YdiL-like domain-containing protein n=1 Tax=Brackiella oedipodis TaxID=124225 RepID=UPI00048BB454|nr:DUF1870 family protein [Brackiella oedipodis]